MQFDKLKAAKFTARFVVGAGVGTIVSDVIANNITAPESAYGKTKVYAGGAVLAMLVKDAAKAYVDTEIDAVVKLYRDMQAKKNAPKEEILPEQ